MRTHREGEPESSECLRSNRVNSRGSTSATGVRPRWIRQGEYQTQTAMRCGFQQAEHEEYFRQASSDNSDRQYSTASEFTIPVVHISNCWHT
ncbi:unnamed protein product [Ectocarpus sp. 6 AP-2014]